MLLFGNNDNNGLSGNNNLNNNGRVLGIAKTRRDTLSFRTNSYGSSVK